RSTKVVVKVAAKRPRAKVAKVTASGVPKRLAPGAAVSVRGAYSPASAPAVKVRYSSSRPSVARIDSAGRLRALKPGRTTLTVRAGSKRIKLPLTVR
ncbi:MAG: Ig-like domain-containing protein, partial [Bifidobacteriaceae bacterium]|nr:Ig-like domain-containing protein [Bifidobacteriaceae bacterium]